MSDRAQRLVSIDLAAPETWPSEVWRAFEKASHERTAANIQGNHNRSGEGNKHLHPSDRYCPPERQHLPFNSPERYLDLSPAERIAEHTGHNEYLDGALKPYAR